MQMRAGALDSLALPGKLDRRAPREVSVDVDDLTVAHRCALTYFMARLAPGGSGRVAAVRRGRGRWRKREGPERTTPGLCYHKTGGDVNGN